MFVVVLDVQKSLWSQFSPYKMFITNAKYMSSFPHVAESLSLSAMELEDVLEYVCQWR